MDRRQVKTRKAIYNAFCELLKTKRYDNITVQNIIDKADVGRSTFYSHFETKELLLNAICDEVFYHIFETDICPWSEKDNNLENELSHILWHIKDSKNDLSGILLSDSGEIFFEYFKKHLRNTFEENISFFRIDIPRDFLIHILVGSFAETVKWWINDNMEMPPETVAEYFMTMIEKH